MTPIGTLTRGTVIAKQEAVEPVQMQVFYVLTLRCENDATTEASVVVSKALYDAACIEGRGHDTVIEYGTVVRIVPPDDIRTNFLKRLASIAEAAQDFMEELKNEMPSGLECAGAWTRLEANIAAARRAFEQVGDVRQSRE